MKSLQHIANASGYRLDLDTFTRKLQRSSSFALILKSKVVVQPANKHNSHQMTSPVFHSTVWLHHQGHHQVLVGGEQLEPVCSYLLHTGNDGGK